MANFVFSHLKSQISSAYIWSKIHKSTKAKCKKWDVRLVVRKYLELAKWPTWKPNKMTDYLSNNSTYKRKGTSASCFSSNILRQCSNILSWLLVLFDVDTWIALCYMCLVLHSDDIRQNPIPNSVTWGGRGIWVIWSALSSTLYSPHLAALGNFADL